MIYFEIRGLKAQDLPQSTLKRGYTLQKGGLPMMLELALNRQELIAILVFLLLIVRKNDLALLLSRLK